MTSYTLRKNIYHRDLLGMCFIDEENSSMRQNRIFAFKGEKFIKRINNDNSFSKYIFVAEKGGKYIYSDNLVKKGWLNEKE